ncbi:uncharacterized protein LOC113677148 [Pocillopora damicornis]|uniref:uncharacterized protein LOC113677148 n=1 Tax=Pocillopora damicornis TaxID=46731 RepID=UPI000F54EEFE|nr:uncharacterized protein LOC113677148 [Pocillopora damicornis]
MSEIITAVFKATIGWLVNKCRDEAAKKLKEGDITDQQFRGIIMREIDDVRSKLDGLSRKDLLSSITSFKEGVELLYEVFEDTRSRCEYGADAAQAACAEAVSLTEGMKHLELTKSAKRKLADAKKRFERAGGKATDAFCNEALSPNDRILSMQYRVIATVLEKIDYPEDVLAPCKVCIEELNSLPVVQQSLREQLKTGFRAVKSLFNKEERRKVISGVCLVNRVAFNVIRTVPVKELFPKWLMIDTGEEKVDLLRDARVREILCKQGMENCSVPWILDHDGEEELSDIATNSSRQYILAYVDFTIKVFDNSGKFVQGFRLPPLIDDSGKQLSIKTSGVRLATDMNDNIYVLVSEESRVGSYWIFKFNKTADQHHKFRVERISFNYGLCKLSVSDSGKAVVLKGDSSKKYWIVDVYETNGHLVCSFGQQILSYPCDITTVSDGRVMVVQGQGPRVVHIFSEQGDHLNKFCLQRPLFSPKIVFHRESQQVAVVNTKSFSDKLYIEIYTKDGEFLRSISIHMGKPLFSPREIAVTTEGCIAVVTRSSSKVIVI